MSVKPLDRPAIAKCPKCQSNVTIPAAKPQPGPNAPVFAPVPSPPPAGFDPFSSPTPGLAPATGAMDFDALNLPTGAIPGGATSPAMGANPYAGGNPYAGTGKAAKGSGGGFMRWVASHLWVTAITVFNVAILISCIFYPLILVVAAVSIPVGLVIIGLLFIPRQHLVQKFWDKVGAQAAGAGAGTIVLVCMGVAFKLMSRLSRNDKLDFSGFTNPANVGALIGSLVGFAVMFSLALWLWKIFGIARLSAGGYLAFGSLLFSSVLYGAIKNENLGDPFDRSHRPGFPSSEYSGAFGPGPEMAPSRNRPSARPPGFPSGAEASTFNVASDQVIRMTLLHRVDADIESVRDQLIKQLDDADYQMVRRGTSTNLILKTTMDPKALAEKIDFGKVLAVSERLRTIHVRVD
ncbi:hypothetical protein [Stieleria varia]|nr:hypothetical protein [Stieleria varia]